MYVKGKEPLLQNFLCMDILAIDILDELLLSSGLPPLLAKAILDRLLLRSFLDA